jgi:hypothetical protein
MPSEGKKEKERSNHGKSSSSSDDGSSPYAISNANSQGLCIHCLAPINRLSAEVHFLEECPIAVQYQALLNKQNVDLDVAGEILWNPWGQEFHTCHHCGDFNGTMLDLFQHFNTECRAAKEAVQLQILNRGLSSIKISPPKKDKSVEKEKDREKKQDL